MTPPDALAYMLPWIFLDNERWRVGLYEDETTPGAVERASEPVADFDGWLAPESELQNVLMP